MPAFVHWPGQLKPRVLREPIHVIDWTPTLASLTGFKFDQDQALKWDGEDRWPLLSDAEKTQSSARVFYWQGVRPEAAAIRQGSWKLIVNQTSGSEQLFDLGNDPNETMDLAEKHPGKVTALRQLLKAERAKDNDALPTP